jgi:uncharacterized Tic20 family protein
MKTSTSANERKWGMLSHALLFTGLFAPFFLWSLRRRKTEFVAVHATEALNFFITCFSVMALMVIAWPVPVPWWFSLPFVVMAMALALAACFAAKRGERFRYPVALRLLK